MNSKMSETMKNLGFAIIMWEWKLPMSMWRQGHVSTKTLSDCKNVICGPKGNFFNDHGVMWPQLHIFILQIITVL